ncbi:MAG: 2OG-Fe(II) oxygenase family protein [Rudaea sp.]
MQIPDILDDGYAEQIQAALAGETEWTLAYQAGAAPERIEHAAYAAMDAASRAAFLAQIAAQSADQFAYAYESYSMMDRYDDPTRVEDVMHRLVDVFHHEPILDFVHQLTGDPELARVRIQATRYLAGHFLRQHDDTGYDRQQRRFAFVFNFSRGWQADWGGLLHFLDAGGRIVDTFVPGYNTLALFKVPQLHCVSRVAVSAGAPRYALTGWFLA